MASGGWFEVQTQPASHAQLQQLRRLMGRRDARLETGLCVVEGIKVFAEAVAAGADVVEVFVADDEPDALTEPDGINVSGRRWRAALTNVFTVKAGVLDKIADTVTPQPVMAIVKRPIASVAQVTSGDGLLIIGVDIRDPGNAGTMIRTAELSGATGVVFLGTSVDVSSPKVVRSSAGAMFHLPVVQSTETEKVLTQIRSTGYRTLATAVHREAIDYTSPSLFVGKVAVVLGNEAHGLDASVDALVDQWITIPMQGRTESLNVGMATAILCFEAARQRSL
jgi:RNA methyltransferase, TrmH family